MPRAHRLLHYDTRWQPGRPVEIQSVQELLPDHLHGLLETLLRKRAQRYSVESVEDASNTIRNLTGFLFSPFKIKLLQSIINIYIENILYIC